MRCGRCRAEVMLGSAQCERCGASLLEGLVDDAPRRRAVRRPPPQVEVAPQPSLSDILAGVPAPPPPTAPPTEGHPAPPPPPPGRPARPARPAEQPAARVETKKSSGCGCLLPILVVVFLGPILAGGRAIWDAVSDAVGGETVEAGALTIGTPRTVTLDDGDRARFDLDGVDGLFAVSVDGADGLDVEVFVTQVDGPQLGSDDDSGPGLDPMLAVDLRAGARYEIDVEERQGDPGDVTVIVEPLRLDGAELVRGSAEPGVVLPGAAVRHRLVGDGGEVVIGARASGGSDPVLVVVDEAGTQLAFDDDTNGRDPEIRLTLAAGQVVTVEARTFGSDGGRFVVEVR